MTDEIVIIANIINGAGVVGLMLAHWLIARQKMQLGFLLSSAGAVFVSIGSAMLSSWPVVFLNVIWLALGVIGYKKSVKVASTEIGSFDRVRALLIVAGFVIVHMAAFVHMQLVSADFGAWLASGFYLISFALMSGGIFQSRHYLFVCLLGYLLLAPHLVQSLNYSVLVNETIGAVVGLWGIIAYYAKKQPCTKMQD